MPLVDGQGRVVTASSDTPFVFLFLHEEEQR
jgi:hypothetical protein